MSQPASPAESPTPAPRHRVQLDMSDEATRRLDELVQRLGASSRAEAIRRALVLLDVVVTQSEKGAKVVLIDRDTQRELIVL